MYIMDPEHVRTEMVMNRNGHDRDDYGPKRSGSRELYQRIITFSLFRSKTAIMSIIV